MNAVKKIGACWRCKFLRKTCTSETPCALCPKTNDRSHWGAVGCQRGTFQAAMRPVVLCQPSGRDYHLPSQGLPRLANIVHRLHAVEKGKSGLDRVNLQWKEMLLERVSGLERMGHSVHYASAPDEVRHNAYLRQLFTRCFPGSRFSPLPRQGPSAPTPLNECILAIAWDITHCPEFSLRSAAQTLESLADLLPRAAEYQANHQEDQLIAQSLICLRSCLEAMRVMVFPASQELQAHHLCSPSSCQVECIAELQANLSLYLEELSRVFFKKVNMRKKHPWWLSTFYSFCVQSFIKKCLMDLEKELLYKERLASEEYLQLPVRLFIASSGAFDPLLSTRLFVASSSRSDPLMSDLDGLEVDEGDDDIEGPSPNDYNEARIAVGQNKWAADGINGSADYLRSLFRDTRPKVQGSSNDGPATNNDLRRPRLNPVVFSFGGEGGEGELPPMDPN